MPHETAQPQDGDDRRLPAGGGVVAAYEPPRISPSVRQALRVGLGGYLVVALFGVSYGAVALLWPELAATSNLIIAALIAAPTGLGLIWPWLTGFKAFGFEVSLGHASADTLEPQLVEAVMRAVESSDPAALERAVAAALPDRVSVVGDSEATQVGFLDALRLVPEVLLPSTSAAATPGGRRGSTCWPRWPRIFCVCRSSRSSRAIRATSTSA